MVILLFLFSFFILTGLLLPNKFSLKRTVVINSDPVKIHRYVNDINMWPRWKNLKTIDSDIVIIPGDHSSGTGAEEKIKTRIGEGQLKIISSNPDEGIDYTIDLERGLYHGESRISYKKHKSGTRVIWQMEGETQIPIIGGFLSIRIDDYVGDFMERSLKKLKKLAETNE